MPRHPRSQLSAVFEKSREDHEVYARSMHSAVKDVVENQMTLMSASKKHGVSKSALQRKVKKFKLANEENTFEFGRSHGFKLIFTSREEQLLSEYIIEACEMCYGLTLLNTRELAYKYAITNNKTVPRGWHEKKRAGVEWMNNFRKRHPMLSLRKPEGTSLGRATSFNKHNVATFFNNLRNVITKHNIQANQIYNCDETGVTNVHKPGKVLANIKQKQIGKVTSAERGTLITMCTAICANGTFVPPFFVFPRKIFKPFMLTGAPLGSSGAAYPSGWMTGDNFLKYIEHFIKHVRCSKEFQILLILDNHESRYDVRVLNMCKDNGIILLTLPPHCSHKLQPLDVSCFFPFKSYYNQGVDDWMLNHPAVPMTIYDVCSVVGTAYPKAFTPVNILNGFKKTGIAPLNSQIFSESDFMSSYVTDRPEENGNGDENKANEGVQDMEDVQDVENNQDVEEPRHVSPIPGPSNIVTPQQIRPHAKAAPRKNLRKSRKKLQSSIITYTPVKDAIEEQHKERLAKKALSEEKKQKAKKVKRQVFNDDISSNSDVSEEICNDSSDLESFTSEYQDLSIQEQDYVIVRYTTKKTVKHYVGQVIKISGDEYNISFMKRIVAGKFVFPDKPDEDTVVAEDILLKLPPPSISGSTTRAARQFMFPVNFFQFKID